MTNSNVDTLVKSITALKDDRKVLSTENKKLDKAIQENRIKRAEKSAKIKDLHTKIREARKAVRAEKKVKKTPAKVKKTPASK